MIKYAYPRVTFSITYSLGWSYSYIVLGSVIHYELVSIRYFYCLSPLDWMLTYVPLAGGVSTSPLHLDFPAQPDEDYGVLEQQVFAKMQYNR